MNALILSAIAGVVMMFSSFLLKEKSAVRTLATVLLIIIIAANILDLRGTHFFSINTRGMMAFDQFALLFNLVACLCTLVFFVLSARDMEKVGNDYSEYFALIFFVLTGVALSASFKSLLILFLGIEIMSIPLYILTGSDKRNLKSNEAFVEVLFNGVFFYRANVDGHCFDLRRYSYFLYG